MMELLRVCDPATDSSCGENHWRGCDEDDLDCAKALAATECQIETSTPAESVACTALLAGPGQVCGPDGCGTDEDCGPAEVCVDNVCQRP
jgi:hypothetical protein